MYNIAKQNEKIDIISKVNSCDYLPAMKEYIINMISQILDFPRKTVKPRYFIQNKNNEKIIMIWYPMSIPFMQKNYNIPIKIYIPKHVPSLPPQIEIEVNQGFAINHANKNILPNTTTIMTKILYNWNMYSSIEDIMNEIYQSFCLNFPIYKLTPNTQKQNPSSFNYNNNNNMNNNNANQYNPYNSAINNNNYQVNNNNFYENNHNFNGNNNNNNFNRSMTLNDKMPDNFNKIIKEDNNQNHNNSNKIELEKNKIINENEIKEKPKEKINEIIKPEQIPIKEKDNINEEIIQYKNKISELETKLSESEKLNESLLKQLDEEIQLKNDLKKIITEKDLVIKEFKDKTNSLEEKIKELNNTLQTINNEKILEKLNLKLKEEDEKPFAINFISLDQKIHYPMSCKSSDLISRLEEELYKEYEDYKEYNTFLTVNGTIVKRFKTVGENNIKKGDAILVNVYE